MHIDELELLVQFVAKIAADMFMELLNLGQTRHEDKDGRFFSLFFRPFRHLSEH